MFRRLIAWLRSKRGPDMVTVYGVKSTGPRGAAEPVALRTIPRPRTIPCSTPAAAEFPAPTPKKLIRVGVSLDPHDIETRRRAWWASVAPDECTFM